jgi:hypothetical protein
MKKKKSIRREKKVDRHLDVPAEANRDKHANFLALERGEEDTSTQRDSGKLFNRNSRKNSGRK